MGSGITKWNITFSSIYKIDTDKVSYYVREKNCVQEINQFCLTPLIQCQLHYLWKMRVLLDQDYFHLRKCSVMYEGAPLPYLNCTVREKYGIVRYFTCDRIRYDTVRYWTVPNSTGQHWTVSDSSRTVPNRLTEQTGTSRQDKHVSQKPDSLTKHLRKATCFLED